MVGNMDRMEGRVRAVTVLLNLRCEIHEMYSPYIDKITHFSKKGSMAQHGEEHI